MAVRGQTLNPGARRRRRQGATSQALSLDQTVGGQGLKVVRNYRSDASSNAGIVQQPR